MFYPSEMCRCSWAYFSPPFISKQKKKSGHLFGNPAVSELCRLSRYSSSASKSAKTLSTSDNSHSQVPHLEFKDPWLSAASSLMV
jgi:hypothetical protein